jgi:UPF0755 protein
MSKDRFKLHLPMIITSIVTVVMIAIVILTSYLRVPLSLPSPGVIYDYSPGISVKTLAHQLLEAEVITHPTLFEWYVRFNGYDKTLQAGEYYFYQGINIRGVVYMMRTGKVIKRALRVQEGSNVRDLIVTLQTNPLVNQTIDYSDPAWFKLIDPTLAHPEGQFMPETYFYSKGSTDIKLLKRMHKDLKQFLEQEWEARDKNLPYQTPYEALIAASIIEKETGVESEREIISGVIVRRLAKNMRLQMDPTVIYGLGTTYDGNITKKDLLTPTAYNTYTVTGLPPTPIAMPSKQSIHAAMHPAAGTSLYFVANGDGSHTFSDTLEQHNQAVEHYLKVTKP